MFKIEEKTNRTIPKLFRIEEERRKLVPKRNKTDVQYRSSKLFGIKEKTNRTIPKLFQVRIGMNQIRHAKTSSGSERGKAS